MFREEWFAHNLRLRTLAREEQQKSKSELSYHTEVKRTEPYKETLRHKDKAEVHASHRGETAAIVTAWKGIVEGAQSEQAPVQRILQEREGDVATHNLR